MFSLSSIKNNFFCYFNPNVPKDELKKIDFISVQNTLENHAFNNNQDSMHVAEFTSGSKTFVAWYSENFKAINIQREGEFKRGESANKAGIQIENGKVSLYVNNNPSDALSAKMYKAFEDLAKFGAENSSELKLVSYLKKNPISNQIVENNNIIEELKKKEAIVYVSITGHPTHIGHMAMVATAIDSLIQREYKVITAYISLGTQRYLKTKLKQADPFLSLEQRRYILEETIKFAASINMFKGIPVQYTDLENQLGDHPVVYNRLRKDNQRRKIFFACGPDLYPNTAINFDRTIVVGREGCNEIPLSHHHKFTIPSYPEYAGLSSTKVRKGEASLIPPKLDDQFRAWFVDSAIANCPTIHEKFTSIRTIEEQRVAHENAKTFLKTYLPFTGAEVEFISSPQLNEVPSYLDVTIGELNPNIFTWEKTTGVQGDIQNDGKRTENYQVLYGAASQFNGCEAPDAFTVKPGNACNTYAGDRTQGPQAQLQFAENQVELINCAGNIGFNGLSSLLDEETKNSIRHGYFMPNKGHYESVKQQLISGSVEYLCVANEPCEPCTNNKVGSEKVHLMLIAAHASGYAEYYVKSAERLSKEEAFEIQFLCALQGFRAQFQQCINLAQKYDQPVIFKPTAVGLGVFENNPEIIAKAFYQAAVEFQNGLDNARVEVRFQVFKNPYSNEAQFLKDKARELVGHLKLNERNYS